MRDTNNNNPDVVAERYNNAGHSLNVLDVCVIPSRVENRSSAAMTPDGCSLRGPEESVSSTDHDIRLARDNASGGQFNGRRSPDDRPVPRKGGRRNPMSPGPMTPRPGRPRGPSDAGTAPYLLCLNN
jgi:hypothetical protein